MIQIPILDNSFKKIKETPNKVLLYSTIQDQNVGQSRIGNPFTFIGRYSSKKHSSFLDYHMKLSYSHVDVTATAVGADLGTCQKSLVSFCKKTRIIDDGKGPKYAFEL